MLHKLHLLPASPKLAAIQSDNDVRLRASRAILKLPSIVGGLQAHYSTTYLRLYFFKGW